MESKRVCMSRDLNECVLYWVKTREQVRPYLCSSRRQRPANGDVSMRKSVALGQRKIVVVTRLNEGGKA